MRQCAAQQSDQLGAVLGGRHRHVRHREHVRDVVQAHVRLAILADHARAVHAENHRQLLDGDVVDDAVVGALQERRINGDHGPHALRGESRRERRRMRFRDADVEEPLRPLFLEDVRPRSRGHGRGDGDEVGVLGRELRERVAEDLRPLRRPGVHGLQPAGDGIVWRASMILFEIGLGQREALSLLRNHVHDAWPLERLHDVEGVQHLGDIVPVNRSEIAEAELFEQHPRRPQILDALFDVLREVDELLAADEVRCPLDHMLHALAHAHADRAGDDRAEVFVDRADVGRDRHAVIVQHDDDVTARIAGVVEGFVGQAAGHRTVAHNGDDFEFQSLQVASRRHPECRR